MKTIHTLKLTKEMVEKILGDEVYLLTQTDQELKLAIDKAGDSYAGWAYSVEIPEIEVRFMADE